MRSALILVLGCAALAACGGTATNSSNGSNANLRGANTNTGYMMNTDTTVKPNIPANATNIAPPSLGNSSNRSVVNHNSTVNANKR